MKVFQGSIEELLWPEKRAQDSLLKDKVPGVIDRTTQRSQLTIPVGYFPDALQPLQSNLHSWLPRFVNQGGSVEIGPIPPDMPVGLLANLKLRAETDDPAEQAAYVRNVGEVLLKLKLDLLSSPGASDAELGRKFANLSGPLLALSKCPDLVVNRGHYFGTAKFNDQQDLSADEQGFGQEPVLSDDDKNALIALLKTF